jgi:hypothetical protein
MNVHKATLLVTVCTLASAGADAAIGAATFTRSGRT